MISSELLLSLPLIVASIILTEMSFLSSDKKEQTNQIKTFKFTFIRWLLIPLTLLILSSFLGFADLLIDSGGVRAVSIVCFSASYPLLLFITYVSIDLLSLECS